MTTKVKHPIRNQTFELLDDGTILVVDGDQERSGIFDRGGKHVSGELEYADPQMLNWVGGKQGV